MDYGEIDCSNLDMFSNSNIDIPSSCSMDSFFDDILKDTSACTHKHTCNPPGPDDHSHTHTCLHMHTKLVSGPSEGKLSADDTAESKEGNSKKRDTGGNQAAVRKYRQKKRAMAASLEDEVARLKAENQELVRSLRDQAALEAEIVRLKCFLVDVRGRLDGEIGSFPYQKPMRSCGDMYPNMGNNQNLANGFATNSCNFQCDNQVHGVGPVGGYGFQNLECFANQNAVCEVKNGALPAKPPATNKRKGKTCATTAWSGH